MRELLCGSALGRLEPRGRVAVASAPGTPLGAPGLPARTEPPPVEDLRTSVQRVGLEVRKQV